MLCQHCNKNESDYRFLVNLGNETGMVHLCVECTDELRHQFQDFCQNWQLYLGQQNSSAGTPDASVMERFGFPLLPRRELGADPFPLDAGEDIRRRRRVSELQAKLRNAVNAEDYETAAHLRDEIAATESHVGG